MIVNDFAVFKLPKSREYQFPAITAMQFWVRAYHFTTAINDYPYKYGGEPNQYQLAYALDTDEQSYNWWVSRGISVPYSVETEVYTPYLYSSVPKHVQPTIWFDFTEERINKFIPGTRHMCQLYSALTGVNCADQTKDKKIRTVQTPYIVVPHDQPNIEEPYTWVAFDGIKASATVHTPSDEEIVEKLMHHNITGVIGYAGWQTYYFASLGYAVIEIVPVGRKRSLMSKWGNPLYRCIEAQHLSVETVREAQRSIENTCKLIASQRQAPNVNQL